MKKNSKLFRAMKLAEFARLNLDEVMEENSLSDKEFNAIREAHDSIASARDAIVRLTKPKRMVSAEAKENGYSEPEELTEFEQRIMRLVNRSTFQKRTIGEDGAKYAAGLLLPYAKKQLERQGQKSAWDEKDESHLIHCVRLINNAEGCTISEQENAITWLKSIKQRIGG